MLNLREAQDGQNGRGGKETCAQAAQRCRRNSPALVPSQKCWVSGVGFGRARCGSAISAGPPKAKTGPAVAILMRQSTMARQRSSNAHACHHAHNACVEVRQLYTLRANIP